MRLRLDTTARRIDVAGRKLLITDADGNEELLAYDKLIVGTGAVPVRPPIRRPGRPGCARRRRWRAPAALDGRHLRRHAHPGNTPHRPARSSSARGYIGLEMADALTTRGLAVTQMEQLPEVLPTVDPQLGALVHAELAAHGVEVLTGTTVQADQPRHTRPARPAAGRGDRSRRHAGDPRGRHGPGRRRRPPRHRPGGRGRGRARRQGRDRRRSSRCAPTCRMCSPPGTASSPTTGCSARPTCRWAPPRTSRAGSPGRTPSAGTGSSRAASAPRS